MFQGNTAQQTCDIGVGVGGGGVRRKTPYPELLILRRKLTTAVLPLKAEETLRTWGVGVGVLLAGADATVIFPGQLLPQRHQ